LLQFKPCGALLDAILLDLQLYMHRTLTYVEVLLINEVCIYKCGKKIALSVLSNSTSDDHRKLC
jgi:hypothetical protein